jgi:RimJ/RimL family protein N-acetyltransferase
MWIRRVFSYHSSKLELLLLSLSPEDRRFRFSGTVHDEAVCKYVHNLQWRKICIYGMYDRDGVLVGAVELVPTAAGTELAIQVGPEHKRRGIGRALMSRAMVHAKLRGLGKLQILCSADNAAMQHLAHGVGMRLTREYGDVEGRVTVGPATAADYMAATWYRVDATIGPSLVWAGGTLSRYRRAIRAINLRQPLPGPALDAPVVKSPPDGRNPPATGRSSL